MYATSSPRRRCRQRPLLVAVVVVSLIFLFPPPILLRTVPKARAPQWLTEPDIDTSKPPEEWPSAPGRRPRGLPRIKNEVAHMISTTMALGKKSGAKGTGRDKAEGGSRRKERVNGLGPELPKLAAPIGTPGKGENDPLDEEFVLWRGADYNPGPKPQAKPSREIRDPIPDPFPLLSQYPPPKPELLRPPQVNAPPKKHFSEATPLLIGFTRNWPQLLQCIVSYIAAGWPPEDIHVVENTGTMFANRDGKLSLQNPHYLNHTQLSMLGVDVIVAPTLLSFAQLQNFYAYLALERNFTEYFWSHQDVLVFSYENKPLQPEDRSPARPFSIYERAVAVLQYLKRPGAAKWANHFFAYDHLTLTNRDAILKVGGWDTHIPFYATDCDMYDRLRWAGYEQKATSIGLILDVSTVLDDVGALLRIPGAHASFQGDPGPEDTEEEGPEMTKSTRGSQRRLGYGSASSKAKQELDKDLVDEVGESWSHLTEVGRRMVEFKYIDNGNNRNMWQLRQSGGQGEPFYRDADGFERGLQMLIKTGRDVFSEKWGHRSCDLSRMGIKPEDAWRLEPDWNMQAEGGGSNGGDW